MNRRDFCRTSVAGVLAASLGLRARAGQPDADRKTQPTDPDRLAKRAVRHFLPGKRTCGEALLAAGCEELGLRSDMVPDIALGLGGGVGLRGHTCGVITGSALAIGLAARRKYPDYAARKVAVMAAVQSLSKEFERKFGATDCRALCGLDLTTAEGRRELSERVKQRTCGRLVEQGARLLAQRLNDLLPRESRIPKLAGWPPDPL